MRNKIEFAKIILNVQVLMKKLTLSEIHHVKSRQLKRSLL